MVLKVEWEFTLIRNKPHWGFNWKRRERLKVENKIVDTGRTENYNIVTSRGTPISFKVLSDNYPETTGVIDFD